MKIFLSFLGALLILLGAVWMLQGFNILPGSSMSGDFKWVTNGLFTAIVGIAWLVIARKRA